MCRGGTILGTYNRGFNKSDYISKDYIDNICKGFKKLKLDNDKSKEAENEIIWNRISNIPTLFADTVTSMQLGEFKGPIKSGAGFHILFLEDKRGDTVKIEDQVLSRHILIQTSEVRSQSQAKKLIYEIKEKLILSLIHI